MMKAAQQKAVAEFRPATVDPMLPVVTFASPGGHSASRIAASLVPRVQCQPQSWRYHAVDAANIDRQSLVLGDGDRVRIACEPARSVWRDPWPILNVRATGPARPAQHRRIDVDHNLTCRCHHRLRRCRSQMLFADAYQRVSLQLRLAQLAGSRPLESLLSDRRSPTKSFVTASMSAMTAAPSSRGSTAINSSIPSSRHQ